MNKIYIDTSVIGGCFDEEFQEWSNKLIKEIISREKIAVISDITLEELEKAPVKVRNILENIPNESKEIISLSEEAIQLSNHYIEEKIVNKNHLVDTRHIAIATINKVDILASWNFKHIVNFNLIRKYNSANLKYGYALLEIRTPREVLNER